MNLPLQVAEQTSAPAQGLAVLVEQLTQKLQAGEPVDLEAFVREHPEHAESVQRLLPALHLLADLGRSGEASAALSPPVVGPADGVVGTLGDFRILGEIGRGGMGVVYEAEQISLGRRVALKVLPFAAALDSKQLQRFKNEAHAAAGLQHTNIVPVYFVGCERGVHFYAMQFVEGQTLAALIADLRREKGVEDRQSKIEERGSQEDRGSRMEDRGSQEKDLVLDQQRTGPFIEQQEFREPTEDRELKGKEAETTLVGFGSETVAVPARSSILDSPSSYFRTVANLGIQAAEALEHAHQLGVIHRDIKPANLMVDARGNLWITDFGLAHCQGAVELTMSGDLLGTLRYMSPEQALAQRVLVDQRTDIYSLGVTLYELLTLEPAFPGTDRRQLLRQIAFDDPKPPRRWNKAIPAELETIILKSAEKNPTDRYATAQEVADDLRRYLENKPIRAKRPTILARARKWTRRHWGVVTATLVTAVVVLAISTAFIWRQWQVSENHRKQAEQEKKRAEAGFRMARDTVDRFFTQVGESPKLKAHGMEKLRKEMLQNAKEFYERFIGEQFDAPLVHHDLGLAHVRLAKIHQVLGDFTAAQASSETAIEILGELARGEPNAVEYRRDLAASYQVLGGVYSDTDRREKAKSAYHQALAIQERLADDYPREPEYRRALAETHIALGLMHSRAEELEQGIVNYEQALDILRKLVSDHPGVTEYRSALAAILAGLGDLYKNRGWYEKAEAALKEAQSASQRLADDHPDDPDYRFLLGLTQWTLGLLCGELSDLGQAAKAEAAEDAFKQALGIFEKLAREHPDVPDYVVYLGSSHFGLGYLVLNQGKPDAAQARFRSAIEIFERVLATEPRHVEARMYLRRTLIFKVMTLVKRGDHAQAIQEAEGVASLEGLIASDMYNIACIFSQSVTAAAKDTKLPQSDRTKLKEQYARRAIDFLHQAVTKGHLNLSLLEADPDLIPLRSREDFLKLVRELKEKTKPSSKWAGDPNQPRGKPK